MVIQHAQICMSLSWWTPIGHETRWHQLEMWRVKFKHISAPQFNVQATCQKLRSTIHSLICRFALLLASMYVGSRGTSWNWGLGRTRLLGIPSRGQLLDIITVWFTLKSMFSTCYYYNPTFSRLRPLLVHSPAKMPSRLNTSAQVGRRWIDITRVPLKSYIKSALKWRSKQTSSAPQYTQLCLT